MDSCGSDAVHVGKALRDLHHVTCACVTLSIGGTCVLCNCVFNILVMRHSVHCNIVTRIE